MKWETFPGFAGTIDVSAIWAAKDRPTEHPAYGEEIIGWSWGWNDGLLSIGGRVASRGISVWFIHIKCKREEVEGLLDPLHDLCVLRFNLKEKE